MPVSRVLYPECYASGDGHLSSLNVAPDVMRPIRCGVVKGYDFHSSLKFAPFHVYSEDWDWIAPFKFKIVAGREPTP